MRKYLPMLALVACSSSSSASSPAPTPSCSQPKKGLFFATLTTTNGCGWWTHESPAKDSVRLTDDYVQYAFSDDTCGTIHWDKCVVTNDGCAPLKFNAGK